jgi:glycosyltransferase involved in cell wall biosynthesis
MFIDKYLGLLKKRSPQLLQVYDSRDHHPWEHPYLTESNISRFRDYSDSVWDYSLEYYRANPEPIDCAYTFNMAQNMYKWARLAKESGSGATLYLHPMDQFAISQPEWEDYDGELSDLTDYGQFIAATNGIVPEVDCRKIPLDSETFRQYSSLFLARNQTRGDAKSLLMLLRKSPSIRYEVFETYPGLMAYYDWADALSKHDVVYAAGAPFCAYASGIPYCVVSVGGDVERDCGRGDWYGKATTIAFNGGRFMMISNPHTLGHSRRLGFTNGVYLPYPMDVNRYSPGEGNARKYWTDQYGEGVYVLTSARIDSAVKGQSEAYFDMLVTLAREMPSLRFIFLAWGDNVSSLKRRINDLELTNNFILLSPVGKKRLVDYYRSCDIVLDQFVYGYYGATALEAFSVGKPVVMKVRDNQYYPLYRGDVVPVINASTIQEIREAVRYLVINHDKRREIGLALRNWLVRNHGESRTMPILLSLLKITADRVKLPRDLISPLCDPLTDSERIYHNSCLVKADL